MADEPVVHIGENSPEQIAWRLFTFTNKMSVEERKTQLKTFAECLMAVKQPYDIAPGYSDR